MNNIKAIFLKQLKDSIKNKVCLIQFILFPLLTVVMNLAISAEDMPANYFTDTFSVMYISMMPMTILSSVVSEEKEKGTLRALLMSGVKPHQYLLGIGSLVWIITMLGCGIIMYSGSYDAKTGFDFMLLMALGCVIPIFLGAFVGIISRSQMQANSISVPLMLVFSMLPLIGMFNDTAAKLAKVTYTYHLNTIIGDLSAHASHTGSWIVITANALVVFVLFVFAYRKKGFE